MEHKVELPYGRGIERLRRLQVFAHQLMEIQRGIGFKVSSRGWCYQLEGLRVIDKGEFGKTQNYINECRKRGYLPIDFVAEDTGRSFSGADMFSDDIPKKYLESYLEAPLKLGGWYDLNFWNGEKFFIIMMVEKVDLVTLFKPICDEYFIPIANTRGWYSIMQRGHIAEKFKEHEDKGRTPILLYCGDHDPFGLLISDLIKKHMIELRDATGWDPKKLIVDRFGLNADFINSYGLSWIDNLQSGSGKDPNYDHPVIKDYIARYGERKCEANALVIDPGAGRNLCREAIEKYLGNDALDRFAAKRARCVKWFDALLEYYKIRRPLVKAIKNINPDFKYELEPEPEEEEVITSVLGPNRKIVEKKKKLKDGRVRVYTYLMETYYDPDAKRMRERKIKTLKIEDIDPGIKGYL